MPDYLLLWSPCSPDFPIDLGILFVCFALALLLSCSLAVGILFSLYYYLHNLGLFPALDLVLALALA